MPISCAVNATTAKIRAIHGKMFTKENYREMLTRKTVPELAEYLARTPRFKDAFKEVDPNTVHRGYLEELLYRENFRTYVRLCKFQMLDKMPFYGFLIKKREIECILSLINCLNSGLENSYLEDLPGYVIKHSEIDLLELSKASDFQQMLKMLKGTPYYKVLVKISPTEDGLADYTECELQLRTMYFENLFSEIKKGFPSGEAKELTDMILKEIDVKNIINAYRMKAFFGFSPEEIKRRSFKFSYMGKKRFKRFCECESPEQMLELISRRTNMSSEDATIETMINRVKYRNLCHTIARSGYAAVSMYAFTQLCDIEVENIVHIIEGIRYKVDSSFIESRLLIC